MLKLNGEKQHHLCRYLCLRVSELLRQRYVEPIHYTYKKLKKKKKNSQKYNNLLQDSTDWDLTSIHRKKAIDKGLIFVKIPKSGPIFSAVFKSEPHFFFPF